ncbi:DNA polymerase III subunit delta' [Enterobacteriaceae bacterium ESL0689]|nr:DNA polymerase III subunit delta' [Enterobacteriaceae bacterium ESL0689]
MKWYPWLRPAFEQWIDSYQAGHRHPALLLQALPGMGGEALIYALCRYLLCQHPQQYKSCGHCHSCQLMQAGTHPDYYTLIAEKNKTALGIDAVRDVNEKLYEHSHLGGAKVVAVSDAQLLTDAAANALLKIVEEPPENSWFFFICQQPAHLLATLRSRCRHYHLVPPSESWALAWLARDLPLSQDVLLTALRLSAGAPAAAQMLLEETHWAPRQQLIQTLESVLFDGDWLALLPILNHEQVAYRLYWLASLFFDAQKRQQRVTRLTNPDASMLIDKLAQTLSIACLQAISSDIFRCRHQLLTIAGINRELLLTERLLRWEHYLQPGVVLPAPHL